MDLTVDQKQIELENHTEKLLDTLTYPILYIHEHNNFQFIGYARIYTTVTLYHFCKTYDLKPYSELDLYQMLQVSLLDGVESISMIRLDMNRRDITEELERLEEVVKVVYESFLPPIPFNNCPRDHILLHLPRLATLIVNTVNTIYTKSDRSQLLLSNFKKLEKELAPSIKCITGYVIKLIEKVQGEV